MTLSVSIICRNEATSIHRCLESLVGADEIVVVDTGSDDNTLEVVRQFASKSLIDYPNCCWSIYEDYRWADDFAAARNHALAKCTGDWILVIDADNRLMNPIEEVKAECELADRQGHKTISIAIYSGERFSHYLPYLFRRDPAIHFKGAIHNHLTRDDKHTSSIGFSCWYSESHHRDPDRSFRILKKVNAESTELVREKYYLAREYYYRRMYREAIRWFERYMEMGSDHAAEIADAYLLMARSHYALGAGDLARETCAKAINVNTNFREAILALAEMSGPINRERWLEFADGADNSGVLFVRERAEWGREQYDQQFAADSDMSRYREIHEEIARVVGRASVLDIGCGVAALAKYIPNYSGFDFSPEAVKIANHPGVWVGSLYDPTNFRPAEFYTCLEVLEHVDDLRVLANIPSGQRLIFSVPSFDNESHLRMYTERIVRHRFGPYLDFQRFQRFNWHEDRWQKGGAPTRAYILLVEATKR